MGKEYGHQYFLAGSGGRTGEMICKVCKKCIDSDTQDWLSTQKTIDYDWEYITRHRSCVDDQRGWKKIEREERRHKDSIRKIVEYLGTCGQDALHDALVEIGIVEG